MTTWTLYGSGQRKITGWDALYELTHDWTAAWADNDGFHWEAMPVGAPNATHLWAWTAGCWLRVRLDPPNWWASILSADPLDPDPKWSATKEVPQPRVSTVLHWTKDDQRVPGHQNRSDERQESLQLQIDRVAAAPFIGSVSSLPGSVQHLRDLGTSAVTPRR